jgi:hypothetical protein
MDMVKYKDKTKTKDKEYGIWIIRSILYFLYGRLKIKIFQKSFLFL